MAKRAFPKRRDSKHRVLRVGESVREDGLYQFKYHVNGKAKFIYSWRLEPTDKLPQGKKPCLSLREMEKKIGYDLDSQMDPSMKNMTVMELVRRYLAILYSLLDYILFFGEISFFLIYCYHLPRFKVNFNISVWRQVNAVDVIKDPFPVHACKIPQIIDGSSYLFHLVRTKGIIKLTGFLVAYSLCQLIGFLGDTIDSVPDTLFGGLGQASF